MSETCVAIGPELSGFGSWNWLGAGLINALGPDVHAVSFRDVATPPTVDVVVFLKFKPPVEILEQLKSRNCRLIFVPVDVYGSASEIDNDIDSIRCFDFVIVHCRRLIRYFNAAARVEYLDHPLKYVLPEPRVDWQPGPLLWVGRRCNISPIVEWVNRCNVTQDLWILTESNGREASPEEFGFSRPGHIRVGTWTPARHLEWLRNAGFAIDIKGPDFRARHKPPAKLFDYLASGIPVLVNRGGAAAMELIFRDIAPIYSAAALHSPHGLPHDYIHLAAAKIRETSAPNFVWRRWRQIIRDLADSS